jgi:hypothetical protein
VHGFSFARRIVTSQSFIGGTPNNAAVAIIGSNVVSGNAVVMAVAPERR